MITPGLAVAIAREREDEISRQAAHHVPAYPHDAPRAHRLRRRLALAAGAPRTADTQGARA